MATTKAPSVEVILNALRHHPDSTAAELAEAAGIGRSTAGKALAVLEAEGYATRRQPTPPPGAKNAPDRWTLTIQTPIATPESHDQPTAEPEPTGQQPAAEQPHETGASQPATSAPETGETNAARGGKALSPAANQPVAASLRLRPGELRSLIHAYLAERPGQELTPTKIGKELGRSAGAVGNALATMTDAGEVTQTSAKPRRYTIPSKPQSAQAS